MAEKTYSGLEEDLKRGMTATSKIVLDAKVFGLIDDDQSCAGWNVRGIEALYDKVTLAWQPYGLIPSRLPDELRQRHEKIFGDAIKIARAHGWDPSAEEDS